MSLGMPMYYKLEGHKTVPVADVLEWARWFESAQADNKDLRRVALTKVWPGVEVSTVFLGLDHSLGIPYERPMLFETMVFGGSLNGEQERYSTWDEAEAGHAAMVKRARRKSIGGLWTETLARIFKKGMGVKC